MKLDPERMEKSLTNLQINIRALAGKMEEMMNAFDNFSEAFKANHNLLVDDMDEVKELANDINNYFRQGFD